MGILAPLALLALSLLAIIVLLYLLKLRRPTTSIPSLRLWHELTRDREANSLWQRLRLSGLMLLQLLALALLVLALARPWVAASETSSQNAIVVIDVSASMGSTTAPGGPTRLGLAKRRAEEIADALPEGARATLISSGNTAAVVVPATSDVGRVRSALDDLQVQPGEGRPAEALALASAVASRQPGSVIWLLSDGAFPPVDEVIPSVEGELRFEAFGIPAAGRGSGNQGITGLYLQNRDASTSLFLQIANSEPVSVSRRVDFIADDAQWSARNIEVGPGSTREVEIPDVPLGARVLQARLGGRDALSLDDTAFAVNRASAPANVLLVTGGNRFLELAVALLPTVKLYKTSPQDYDPDATVEGRALDVTIVDAPALSGTVQTLPDGPLMLFSPVAGNALVTATGVLSEPVLLPSASSEGGGGVDPLLKFVDLSGVHIARAVRLVRPQWARVLAESSDGEPLIMAGTQGGRNVAVFAFDLHDTDLPIKAGFPLLMRNLVNYLVPTAAGGLPALVAPREPVTITPLDPSVSHVIVEDPNARETTLVPARGSNLVFGDTGHLGVYYVTQYRGEEIVGQEAFAVNLFSRTESTLAASRAPGLPLSSSVGGRPDGSPNESVPTRQEIWPLVAVIGLLLLLLEWLVSQRIVIRRAITMWQSRRAAERLNRT